MSKGTAAVTNSMGQLARVLQRLVLGALCGVGFVWTLTTAWPTSRPYVTQFGHWVQKFSGHYPVVTLGLVLGVGVALLWQATHKGS